MQRMALMGLVGVSMVGLGAGAWGLQARSEKKPELLFSRSREVLCAEKGMGELADERRSLDAAHLVIRSRVENRQLLVRGFMAGHWSTDQVLQETANQSGNSAMRGGIAAPLSGFHGAGHCQVACGGPGGE